MHASQPLGSWENKSMKRHSLVCKNMACCILHLFVLSNKIKFQKKNKKAPMKHESKIKRGKMDDDRTNTYRIKAASIYNMV
jgi:hypothetical protein